MENSLWEIRQKVKFGESLTDAENEKIEVFEAQFKETLTPYKAAIKKTLEVWRHKKSLWEQDRNGIALDIGYNPDFERVIDFLIENTDWKGKTFSELVSLSDTETIELFDIWAAIYPDHRKQERIKIKAMLLPPPAEAAPVVEGKAKTGRNKDPYNAKIKAKFFDMVIENDATIMGKKIYQNNEEKFAAYANTMHESFGMVVEPGTLKNNWNKNLNEPEKKLLRELLITQNYRNLAVTVAVTM